MTRSLVVPLRRPPDGLLARLALVRGDAGRLDLQYYLWDSDEVGYLLLRRLIAAADRGVSVRIVVDGLKLRRRTRAITSLRLHPNIELRVFSSFSARSAVASGVELIRLLASLDERMHNTLLITDDERAIFGARNIANPSAHSPLTMLPLALDREDRFISTQV